MASLRPHGHADHLGVGSWNGARSSGPPAWSNAGTPRGAGGLRDHERDGAARGALLRALPLPGVICAPGREPTVLVQTRDQTTDLTVQERVPPHPATGHGSCGSPWASREKPLPCVSRTTGGGFCGAATPCPGLHRRPRAPSRPYLRGVFEIIRELAGMALGIGQDLQQEPPRRRIPSPSSRTRVVYAATCCRSSMRFSMIISRSVGPCSGRTPTLAACAAMSTGL